MPLPLPIIGPIIDIVGKVIDRVVPDKAAAERAKRDFEAQALTQEFQLALGQLEINKAEASHASIFVAGWRPCVGWICAAALGYATILEPVGRFVAKVWFGYGGAFPVIDTMLTMQVLLGLLGLGGLRTWEKQKDVARDALRAPTPPARP